MSVPHHFYCKNLLPYVQSKSPHLKTFPFALSQQSLLKSLPLRSHRHPLDIKRSLSGLPRALSSPGWTAPDLSACPHREGVPSIGSFLWSSSGCSLTGPHLSCTEDFTPRHSMPGEVSPAQSRGAESPPSICWPCYFWCSPGYGWLSGLQGHIAGSCPAYHPPLPPRPFWQRCSPSLYPPACTTGRGCHNPGARPCTWIYWTSWCSPGPTAWACLDLSEWHPIPWACQPHHTTRCYSQTGWGCTQSHCQCHWWRSVMVLWFLLSVLHIITSCSAMDVKELMLQFHGLSIVPGIPVSEEKKNYISQRIFHCSVSIFHSEGKIKLLASHKTPFFFFFFTFCLSVQCVCSLAVPFSALE